MKKGVGVDIIEIDRIKNAVKQNKKQFLTRVFTPKEISYCTKGSSFKFPELAARFAAKEAYSKAIGTGIKGIGWQEIEVVKEKTGKPNIYINGKKAMNVELSISHSRDYAAAVVMIS